MFGTVVSVTRTAGATCTAGASYAADGAVAIVVSVSVVIGGVDATFGGGGGFITCVPDVHALHVIDEVLEAGAVVPATADALPRILGEGYHSHRVRPRARGVEALRELLSLNLKTHGQGRRRAWKGNRFAQPKCNTFETLNACLAEGRSIENRVTTIMASASRSKKPGLLRSTRGGVRATMQGRLRHLRRMVLL